MGNRPVKGLAFDSIMLMSGNMFSVFLQFLVGVAVIRFLTPEDFGVFSLANTFVKLAGMVAAMGLATGIPSIVNNIGAYKGNEKSLYIFSLVYGLTAATAIALAFVLFREGASSLLNIPDIGVILAPIIILLYAFAVQTIATGVASARGKVKNRIWLFDIAPNMAKLIAVVSLLVTDKGLQELMWSFAFVMTFVNVLYFFYSYKGSEGRVNYKLLKKTGSDIWVYSVPLLGIAFITNVVDWFGSFVLAINGGPEAVGIYNAAMRIAKLLLVPSIALRFILIPAMVKIKAISDEHVSTIYKSITRLTVSLAALPFVVICADAEFIVKNLFGAAYLPAVDVLRLLSVAYISHVLGGPNISTLIAFQKQRVTFFINCFCALVFLVVAIGLAKEYGVLGVCLAVIVSYLLLNGLANICLKILFRIEFVDRRYLMQLSLLVAGMAIYSWLIYAAGEMGTLAHISIAIVWFLLAGSLCLKNYLNLKRLTDSI